MLCPIRPRAGPAKYHPKNSQNIVKTMQIVHVYAHALVFSSILLIYAIVVIMLSILYEAILKTLKKPANAHMQARIAFRGHSIYSGLWTATWA